MLLIFVYIFFPWKGDKRQLQETIQHGHMTFCHSDQYSWVYQIGKIYKIAAVCFQLCHVLTLND